MANDTNSQIVMYPLVSYTTNWAYPNVAGTHGSIKQANVNLCMQLNHDLSDQVEANSPCSGDLAEQWLNTYIPGVNRTVFESEWYLVHYKQHLCLTADGVYVYALWAKPCTYGAKQLWGTS